MPTSATPLESERKGEGGPAESSRGGLEKKGQGLRKRNSGFPGSESGRRWGGSFPESRGMGPRDFPGGQREGCHRLGAPDCPGQQGLGAEPAATEEPE